MSVVFELCQDPDLLDQYYALRQRCFRAELGIGDFDGSEDEQDRSAQILIAHQDGICIGGARIASGQTAHSHAQLLNLANQTCCSWERLVFEPAARNTQLLRDFCEQLIWISKHLGYQHALIMSSLRNARFYRQCHTALGVSFRIHRQVPELAQGEFAALEHYLSVADLHDGEVAVMAA